MRQFERGPEDLPIDPETTAELEAIDATLAGRIVDAEFAELAELAVLVAAERPKLSSQSAQSIDERMPWRLGPGAPRTRGSRWGLSGQWAAGMSLAAAAVVAVVVLLPGSGASNSTTTAGPGVKALALGAPATGKNSPIVNGSSSAGSSSAGSSSVHGSSSSSAQRSPSAVAASPTVTVTPYSSPAGSAANGALTPAPAPTARKTIQSAQLQLTAPSRWVDVVAQELFDVVGQEKGVVRSSQVTGATGSGGYATFDLSIPTVNLADTVTRLSLLQHAQVASRTDGTQDVNGQYLSDQRRLGDARALRTSLLKQLAAATTQAQITSLQTQIRDAEASISSDESTLSQLQNQISFSQLYVTVNSGGLPLPLLGTASTSSGGFTIGRAAHDSVRVLTVAAGVALITLAALVPIGLLVALGAWIAMWFRRRRREHALDTA